MITGLFEAPVVGNEEGPAPTIAVVLVTAVE